MHIGFLEDWKIRIRALSRSRQGLFLMALVCFLEPIFLPMIPEIMIAPIMIARKSEAMMVWVVALAATLCGVVVAYTVAGFAGKILILYLGQSGLYLYETGLGYLEQYGFFLPLIGSFTPFPLKVIVWTCGLTHFNFAILLSGIFMGRAARYGLIPLLQKTHANKDRIRIQFNPRRKVRAAFFRKENA